MFVLPPITPVEPNTTILHLTHEEQAFISKTQTTIITNYDDICQICSYAVLQSVFQGSHVFDKCSQQKHKTMSMVVLPLMLRNVLEEGQAASLLIRSHLYEPAWIICRTLLESYYSISFLLEAGVVDEERANAFLAWTRREALEELNSIEADVKTGNLTMDTAQLKSNTEHRKNIDLELQKPRYSKYATQYKKNTPWYRLYSNKLNHLRDLAKHLGMEDPHVTIYKYASLKAHAADPFHAWVQDNSSNKPGVYATRNPNKHMPILAVMISSIINGCLHKVAHAYLKQDTQMIAGLNESYKAHRVYLTTIKSIQINEDCPQSDSITPKLVDT